MNNTDRGADGKFLPGNEARLTHGGSRAVQDLAAGRPLRGVALEFAQEVAREIAEDGPIEFLWARAIDHAAVARLYFGLLLAEDDAVTLDGWTKRFGWLNAATFRMVRDIIKLEGEQDDGGALDYEAILAAREARGDDSQ
jgi:hypothetical protein